MVPVDKATLTMVKVLVGAREGLLPHQQRFVVSDAASVANGQSTTEMNGEEDGGQQQDIYLPECNIKPYSTLHLVLRNPFES